MGQFNVPVFLLSDEPSHGKVRIFDPSSFKPYKNGFRITLKTLEDNLLSRLSQASGNFLGDLDLLEDLKITKRTAAEIEDEVTEAEINDVTTARASLLYFIMNDLNKIHPMDQFSLKTPQPHMMEVLCFSSSGAGICPMLTVQS